MENTSIIIIHGTNDRIVPMKMTTDMVNSIKGRIKFISIDGQGHDPFEENVQLFVDKLSTVINL